MALSRSEQTNTPVEPAGPPSRLRDAFPKLAALPRAALGTFPSPVHPVPGVPGLWVKRDDLNVPAPMVGGNKVRALEWLLGGIPAGATVLTAGGDGSTHVLATATHARRVGVHTVAVQWRHEMHPMADAVAARSAALCARTVRANSPALGLVRLALLRLTHPDYHYLAPGGSTPLGTLGHVDAAFELAAQVDAGELPAPTYVVVPLGSGGTAAGLALGFGLAGLHTTVIAVRVVPRSAAPVWHLNRLISSTRALLARAGGPHAATHPAVPVHVDHTHFGGAYGRPLAVSADARQVFGRMPGLILDDTYSAKAALTALDLAARADAPTVLFWLTFDGRSLA